MEVKNIIYFISLIAAVGCRPFYIDCIDSSECGKNECCSIGMGRFTMPTCRPRPDLGEVCRHQNMPLNTTVNYPDNHSVKLTNVYMISCPCGFGLECGTEGICEDRTMGEFFNQLEYY